MQAVILAGGLGTRLKPFTEIIPKPLLPIGESSVLEIQVLSLKKHGVSEIFIATNYMSDYVEAFLGNGEKYGVKLHYSREKTPLGTCGPVGLLRNVLAEPFILMNGDILTTLDFSLAYEFATNAPADLIVGTKEIVTPFNFGKISSDGDLITGVEEKPDLRMEIVAGIYILKPSIFRLIPEGKYYGMDNLIRDMLTCKQPVARYQIQEYWLDIGRIDDFETARGVYKEHFAKLKTTSEAQ